MTLERHDNRPADPTVMSGMDSDGVMIPVPYREVASGEVIEGEIVSDEEPTALDRHTSTALVPVDRTRPVWTRTVRVVHVACVVATHDLTKTTGRVLVRHTLAYPVAGLGVAVRR
jgi:hypothetical protein